MLVKSVVRNWQVKWGSRWLFTIMLANELWSNTLLNGSVRHSLFSIDWFESAFEEDAGVRVYSLIILWLSVRLAVRHK